MKNFAITVKPTCDTLKLILFLHYHHNFKMNNSVNNQEAPDTVIYGGNNTKSYSHLYEGHKKYYRPQGDCSQEADYQNPQEV